MPARRTLAATATLAAVLVTAAAAAGAAPAERIALHSRPGVKVPIVTVTKNDPGTSPGNIFLTPRARVGDRSGPLITDAQGRPVWFHPLSAARTALGLQPQLYRGKPVLTWGQRPPIAKEGDLYKGNPHSTYDVIADDSYRIIARLRAKGSGVRTDMHDFVITKRNTALVLGFRFVRARLDRFGGPARGYVIDQVVQEVTIPDNRVLFSWSAVRHIPLDESYLRPGPTGTWDPFHVNSIDEDSDGDLLITARHSFAVYKVSRSSGRVLWKLGGKDSSFSGNATQFFYAHDAHHESDGTLTLFDNAGSEFDTTHGPSKAIQLRLDMRKKTASVVREFSPPNGKVVSTSQGNARLLPGGNVFVGWGTSPWLSEHAPDGRVLFAAHMPSRIYQSYRAFKAVWHGKPLGEPAVAASTATGKLRLYVSWNGATEVAKWRVLGGDDGAALKEIAVADWNGLETKIEASATPKLLKVEALDANGKTIGTSAQVQPTPPTRH
jgi:hypothetical protein